MPNPKKASPPKSRSNHAAIADRVRKADEEADGPWPPCGQRRQLSAHGCLSYAAADSAGEALRDFITKHPGHLPEDPLPLPRVPSLALSARREGCRADLVQRTRRGIAGSLLRRRTLREPLDGEHHQRGAGSRTPSARRAWSPHFGNRSGLRVLPRSCCRCSSAGCTHTSLRTYPPASNT